jgi:nucleoside-diphosphate-sugar epimerase
MSPTSPLTPIDGQTVLVTGGAGFLGRHLVAQLLARRDVSVRVLALPHEPTPATWGQRVDVVRGDITRCEDVEQAAQACTTIFHLAALVGDGASYADHERVTAGGTRNVLQVAQASLALVVLTTSICAYGDAIQTETCAEDTPKGRFQGPYSRAKQLQEEAAWQCMASKGRIVIVRPANIIGPGCGPWLNDAAQALRQGLPALISGGQGNAALTVVDNVADFLLLVAQRPEAVGRAFNVHDGLDVTWRQYFQDLARLLDAKPPRSTPRWLAYLAANLTEGTWRAWLPGRRPPVTREALNLIAWNSRFPLDRAQGLGWQPRVSYEQALGRMGEDIRQRGL